MMDKKFLIDNVILPIEAKGGKAYFVGGCVRDEQIGLEPNDYDIVTDLTPSQLHNVFSKFSNVSTNAEQFGVTMPLIKNEEIEIATFRKDLTKGRHPQISLEASIEEDAARRDFTINALYEDKDGNILDPTGFGLSDIKKNTLRFVGNARDRLSEDPLRAYRFMRFASKGFDSAYSVKELMELGKGIDYSGVSKERKLKEIKKIFSSKYFLPNSYVYAIGLYLGIFEDIGLKEIFANMSNVAQSFQWHAEGCVVENEKGEMIKGETVKDFSKVKPVFQGSVYDHTCRVWEKMNLELFHSDKEYTEEKRFILTLSAILHDIGKTCWKEMKENTWKWGENTWSEKVPKVATHDVLGAPMAEEFCKKLGLSNIETETVKAVVRQHMNAHRLSSHKRKFDILEFVHQPHFEEIMLVSKADDLGSISTIPNDYPGYENIIKDPRVVECINTEMPKPVLTGNDLIERGLKPSSLFKKMLHVAYRHQYEYGETDKNKLFNFVKNIKE